ncbi:MAG: pilus biogenesis protein [Nitrospirales bacterium]|nr:MAG: pilus biogenesis protein [Nitrospirales bacterium]
MKTWLLDTGPLVAYLDQSDPAHDEVTPQLDNFRGQLVTTSAVITETMHFVAESQSGPRLLADFVNESGMQVYDFSQPSELYEASLLMEKYADTPMDYADATLIILAQGLGVTDIVTLDRRGFSTYRTQRRRSLHLVLG